MAQWDLFVDESGSFDIIKNGKQEHNLVGGFVVPRGLYNKETATSWNEEIRGLVVERFGEDVISSINRYHTSANTGNAYDFMHSEENHLSGRDGQPQPNWRDMAVVRENIRDIQLMITDYYKNKIKDLKGYIVVFDDPIAHDFGGNFANYLTIIGKGVVVLFHTLIKKEIDTEPELFLNIAHRDNWEKDDDDNVVQTNVVQLQTEGHIADSKKIDPEEYRQSIKNAASMIAGALNDNPSFKKLFESEEHIKTMSNYETNKRDSKSSEGTSKKTQNPMVVPCDFICNTYYRGTSKQDWFQSNEFKSIYRNEQLSIIIAIAMIDKIEESNLEYMENDRSYAHRFLALQQIGFPKEQLLEFYKKLNKADEEDQRYFVRQIAARYDLPVRNCIAEGTILVNKQAIEDILSTMKDDRGSELIENQVIRVLLRANMYLLLYSVLIHLGESNKRITKAHTVSELLEKALSELPVSDDKIDLYTKYLNRRIVEYTDTFDYVGAKETFEKLSGYWEYALLGRQELFDTDPKAEEFGEEIGSYLQVITHKLGILSKEERETEYKEILERKLIDRYLSQFHTPMQFNRCYQNLADLESGMGNFDMAFEYLYKDAVINDASTNRIEQEIRIDKESLAYVDRIADSLLRRINNPNAWLCNHFVRFAADMIHYGDPRAKLVYQTISNGLCKGNDFDMYIKEDYLCAITYHKLGILKTYFEPGNRTGDVYFKKATDLMSASKNAILKTIGVAIHLDWIASLLQRNKWSDVLAHIDSFNGDKGEYRRMCDSVAEEWTINPFAVEGQDNAMSELAPDVDIALLCADVNKKAKRIVDGRLTVKEKEELVSKLQEDATILHALSRRVAY